MASEESNEWKVGRIWKTIQEVVAVLSGLVALAGIAAYIGKVVIAYLNFVIYAAVAIFAVSLFLLALPRFRRIRKERAAEAAASEALKAAESLRASPVKVDRTRVKILGVDPKATGLRFLDIPLNKTPDDDWVRILYRLPVVYLFLHEAKVVDDVIETEASEDMVEQTVNAIADLVDKTNQEYAKFIDEGKARTEAEKAKRAAEDRKLRDIEDKVRRG